MNHKHQQSENDQHEQADIDIPPALVRAGIKYYESNLQSAERVKLPVNTPSALFKEELMERLTTVWDDLTVL